MTWKYYEEFYRSQLALLVFDINRMEGTLSARLEQGPTMKLIRSYFGNVEEPETVVWDSEGGREEDISSTKRQLYQCVKAVEFLLIQNLHQPLSMALILDTHRIMMEHSYSYEGFPKERIASQVGQFRTTDVGAGMFYLFPPVQSITGGIRELIVDYNDDSVVKHPIEKATLLFYELIINSSFFEW